MRHFVPIPGARKAMRNAMEQAGFPRQLARRADRYLDRLYDAAAERGELFPDFPTWLLLAQAAAREVRVTRQESLVRAAALRLLGDAQAAERWVSTPREDFGGRTPLRMARTEGGVTKVFVLVARLERERAAGRKA